MSESCPGTSSPIRHVVVAAGTFPDCSLEERAAGGRAVVRLADIKDSAALGDVEAIIVTTHRISREELSPVPPTLRLISRAGIGLDAIDIAFLKERGIGLINTPGYATREVAAHALAMVLALNRRLLDMDRYARNDWAGWRKGGDIRCLADLTLGVVGAGRIGRATIQAARGLVGRILVYDSADLRAVADTERVGTLNDLLRRSDIVTLHLPLTAETRELIGREQLALMPSGAIFVNTSRGGLVDENALAEALINGHLGGAGVDVFQAEPPWPGHPLLSAPNTLLTPHVAWYSNAAEVNGRTEAIVATLDYLEGRTPSAGQLVLRGR